MKNPEGLEQSVQRGSRWARSILASVALIVGGTAWAQTYGTSTYAGAALQAGNTDTATGPATGARFNTPKGVAVDSAGNLYVADAVNNSVRKIAATSGITTTIGTGFLNPSGVAVDSLGNVYVADTGHHRIAKIVTTTVSILAGDATAGTSGLVDNATGTTARFFNPSGIAVNSGGTLVYVADTGNHVIRRIDLSGTVGVTTIAGTVTSGVGTPGAVNGTPGTAASFNIPYALALNAAGTLLFVADRGNHAIRQVDLSSSNAVTLFAGTAGTSGSTDAPALFKNPEGVTIDAGGILYVSDSGNATIRKITSAGLVSTIAGTAGQSGTLDALGTAARFQEPFGIAVNSSGVIYVADAGSQTVRRLAAATAPSVTTPVSTPAGNTVTSGGSISFSTTLTGSPAPAVTWQMLPAVGGTFTALTITSPYSVVTTATTSTLTITGATSTLNGNQYRVFASNGVPADQTSAAVTLLVNQPPTMANTTTTGAFTVNASSTFSFTATGSPAPTLSIFSGNYPVNAALTQFVSGSTTTGTITWSPSSSEASGSPYTFTVKASNGFGTDATQTFTFTVLTGPAIVTQPVAQIVGPGQNAQFTVGATSNGGTLTYQWQRQAAGTFGFFNLVDGGNYLGSNTATLTIVSPTQPMTNDQFQVVVSSGIGTAAISSPVSLSVAQPPTITSLNTASFVEGQSGIFTVTAFGSPAPSFTLTYGSLPSGLSLNPSTGVISGFPAAGTSATSPYVLQVTASNGVNPGATQNLTIIVSPTALAPTFTTQPTSITVALGQTATFTVAVTGNPTPTIQWQRLALNSGVFVDLFNDATFSGVNSTMLTITNPTSSMSGDYYRANAVSSSGTTPSSAATLTLVIGTTISTFAGQASVSGSTDGIGLAARFNGPAGMAVDSYGNLYVADSSNHVIRKVTTAGVVTTLAGLAGVNGSADGTGSLARFNAPSGIAVTGLGTVYVADTYNHTIRVISPEGVVTTLAGLAGNTGSADGTGSTARFMYPYGIAVDAGGTVHVADTFNHTIRRIQPGGIVITFAGTAGARGTANAYGVSARFAFPFALALDPSGNLYVADAYNHAIRKIDTLANVTTLAGNPGIPGSVDGIGTGALFNQPSGVAVDPTGNVYVADTYNNTVRRITNTGVVTTMAGLAGSPGSVDGVGNAARFNQPFGIAVDAAGNIFVADTRNHTIRRSGNVTAPTITAQPQSAVAVVGGTATFTVAAAGAPTPSIFTWLRQPANTYGFTALNADGTFIGVNSATLAIAGVTSAMNGDQFQVVVSNLISPNATSIAATLTVGTAPVFTSAASTTFQAANAGRFTFTATSVPAATFSATGLPSWATLNATTGELSGTPPDTTGAPFTITVTASNGLNANQTFTLSVLPAVLPPTITNQPANAAVDQGGTAVFSVAASGTAPFTYQWSRNGVPIGGATGANLSVSNAQPAVAGSYTVTVTNAAGSVNSTTATLVVNTVPFLAVQPRPQTALAGSVVTLSVTASGGTSFNYQWRKNGVPIAGANGATLTLTGVTTFDVGNYDVLVSNSLGTVGSSLAQLNVVSAPVAPVVSSQPASRTIVVGSSVTLSVGASGAPSPSYQWRKNSVPISGAINSTFAVTGAQAGDTGTYDVIITNSAGTVLSSAATVRVLARSYAGTYFGSFAGGLGTFAVLVRDDNTGVFLGYLPGSSAPVMSLNLSVSDSGTFSLSQPAIASAALISPSADEPARAAALSAVVVTGTIAADGSMSGAIAGGANASLSASRASDTGATQGVAGFYQAGASNSAAISYTIAGPNSQAFAIVQSGNTTDGGTGTVTVTGAVNVFTSRSIISATITPATGLATGNVTGAITASFAGASEAALARQRLVNISSRARVGTGDSQAIAGFVISGEDSKPVLIRAVGPTLGAAPFNVAGVLASPRLELFRGSTSLSVNTGIAASRAAIDAAGLQAGAFALGSSGADAAILTTLAPGAYTAVVSSTTNTAGVALVEVYDLSAAAPGQKLLNIATRASAGTADNTLIAGFVVPAGATKRVLVRGVGPGLTVFGVSGVIAQPTLQLFSGSTTVAQNTNWSTSADRDAISTSSAQVGAFGLANNDSALIATLAPGNYTAIVTGAGGTTGVALIEVYELP